MSLLNFGKIHNTDKVSHGFIPFYESFMNGLKDRPIQFLEIGVFYGASLKMWADYFTNPDTVIYGADWFKGINGNKHHFENPTYIVNQRIDPRIKLVELNQADSNDLDTFRKSNLVFDFILDDGSHLMEDQQKTFLKFFDMVAPGGYYIIEDLHTSFDKHGYDVEDGVMTTYEMVESLKRGEIPVLKYGTLPLDILGKIQAIEIFTSSRDSITCFIRRQ